MAKDDARKEFEQMTKDVSDLKGKVTNLEGDRETMKEQIAKEKERVEALTKELEEARLKAEKNGEEEEEEDEEPVYRIRFV